jgi:hypothetical protein
MRISNIVLTGKLPLKRKLNYNEILRFIDKGKLDWNLIDEERTPRLQTIIAKDEYSNSGKQKKACITIWFPNTINMTGIKSVQEAEEYFDEVLGEFKRIVRSVVENGKK